MAMETTSAGHQYMEAVTDKLNDVEAIYAVMKTAAELSMQVREMVNKIAGLANEATGSGVALKEATPTGLLPSLGREARDAREDMASAIRALRRLESQLP